ncbi:Hemin uptake protein HemP [Chelatococcus sambhunathii]|uniref:Hemin uptake protein HemP n=2 Tax=Chelatococcus TaxID=28209 RepID=A0AAC9JVU6_9HYPH|nr:MULTISPECIES: hemin uptake protein HemP [Chelatococcus]APF39551.1 hemin uptake protein HemP [Chelatococcus daeguensis]CUA87718.1 Hemin uptake protein HemP [Chelatococcus sambhunathii]
MSTSSLPSAPSPAPLKAAEPPAIDVRSLFAGGREVVLLHKGERYHLRITANDKLILTK